MSDETPHSSPPPSSSGELPEKPKLVRRSSSNELKRQDSITILANTLMWADASQEDEASRDAFNLLRGHERSSRVGGKLSTASISSIEEELDVAEDFELPDLDDEEEPWDKDTSNLEDKGFVLDPDGDVCYVWLGVVTMAVLYNFWTIIFRTAFKEDIKPWANVFTLVDYLVDFIYIVDVFVQFHVGYLEHGILVRDQQKLREHYRKNPNFVKDIIALLPTFVLTIFADFALVIIRFPRLMKLPSLMRFVDMADSRTSYPNRLRAVRLLVYLSSVIHWVACFQYMLSEYEGFGSNSWVYPALEGENAQLLTKYIKCLYWSLLTLTAIGETPNPETNLEYVINGMTFLVGVMIFAAVVGNVGDVISNMNAARMDFQSRMDCIKQYMNHRGVPEVLQRRVKKWLDYSWTRTQALDEASLLGMLPGQLRAEIAIHVHLETLKKVDIFANCERGFLCELVLKLRSQIFSPGDYICREGEVGREMYIINHGKVQCIIRHKETNEREVVRTLREGNYFGEISLLKLDGGCNKRTADIRSVGYSELFILSKKDLLQALHYYPEAREILERLGRERLGTYAGTASAPDKPPTAEPAEENAVATLARKATPARVPGASAGPKSGQPPAATPAVSSEVVYLSAILRELKSFDSLHSKDKIGQLSAQIENLEKELRAKENSLTAKKGEIEQLQKKLASQSTTSRRRSRLTRQSLDHSPNGLNKRTQKNRRASDSSMLQRQSSSDGSSFVIPSIRIIGPTPTSSPLPVPKIIINDREEQQSDTAKGEFDDLDFSSVFESNLTRKIPFSPPTANFLGSSLLHNEDAGLMSAYASEFESDSDFLVSD